MVRNSAIVAGVAGGALAAAGAWTLYQRSTTETVPYTVVAHIDDVELRRYPEQAVVETTATSENAAFGRLFRYLSGANDGGEELSMTAPVEVGDPGPSIEMTAPVETRRVRGSDEVRMAFYLPPEYDVDSAPRPTSDDVTVVEIPERTLAARRFTWRPTDARVARETERLLETLETAGIPLADDPFFLGYDAPWTLPFLRRNEVAVELEAYGGS
ncbi:heme-binding protein [Natronorubrum sp. JWXQ-INN-674]|uniref:Heme-binding protein n=1 Tax=Natronorubrum halalkaliphilum TaxID=2691917 RepID=A0A6B0VQT3_9EURY|nr:heme-binding protein [Natronorubrum halalkaliphilum]MXV63427.1 heme-binding protein [Natronorubrum halalkaliphilum]